jgi:hypothetical protein
MRHNKLYSAACGCRSRHAGPGVAAQAGGATRPCDASALKALVCTCRDRASVGLGVCCVGRLDTPTDPVGSQGSRSVLEWHGAQGYLLKDRSTWVLRCPCAVVVCITCCGCVPVAAVR